MVEGERPQDFVSHVFSNVVSSLGLWLSMASTVAMVEANKLPLDHSPKQCFFQLLVSDLGGGLYALLGPSDLGGCSVCLALSI